MIHRVNVLFIGTSLIGTELVHGTRQLATKSGTYIESYEHIPRVSNRFITV